MPLPYGTAWNEAYPNKGAAIAWSNHAQALLLLGQPEQALISARKATQEDPAYIKGHHRELKALQALGKRGAAAEIKQEIEEYEFARQMYPAESIALLTAGWVSWKRQAIIYSSTRFGVACRELEMTLESEDERKIDLRASLVPFQGGQGLMMTVAQPGLGGQILVECLEFQMADHENGDMADAPPNGQASQSSLKHVPILLAKCIADMQQYQLETVSVMCGQGLTEHAQMIQAKLRAGGEPVGDFCPAMPQIRVYRAASTYASEEAGLPPNIEALMETLQ